MTQDFAPLTPTVSAPDRASTSPLMPILSSLPWRLGAIVLGGAVLIGAISLGLRQENSPTADSGDTNDPAVTSTPAMRAVTLATVQSDTITRRLETTGTVRAYDLLPILAQAGNLQIQEVRVDEGDWVTAGQVLVILDGTVLRAQIQQAEAQKAAAQSGVQQRRAALVQAQATLAEAQSNLARFEALGESGAISEQELEARRTTVATAQEGVHLAQANIASAEAEVQSQEARLNQLQIQLAQTHVSAPAAGMIAERFARIGNLSSNQEPLFSVIREGRLELEIPLPETQLSQIQPGIAVQVRSDSDPALQLRGTVREIAPLVDPETRQARVKVDLPASTKLRPGMFLQASIELARQTGLVVPTGAVVTQADGTSGVFRWLEPDQVQFQAVTLGEVLETGDPMTARLEIVAGLEVGDPVVLEGAAYVKDGDRVQVVEAIAIPAP
ncbi:MAG: efflux RND transporter periplasmic adaptor subunit [Prochlorothrix sp.]